jgi:iron complex transport system ATP-binding protein
LAVSGRWLVRDVTLAVRPGEVIGLVGANGAGKSTLLRLIAGYVRPTVGTVLIEGRPVAAYRPRERARIVATVPQLTSIEGERRAEDIVLLGRHPHLGRFAIEGEHDRAIARLAMRSTDTDWLADRPVSTLSGGERQRLLIARALAQEPRLLLLDEPTASLDLRQELHVVELIRRLADDGLAVVAAIHDLRLAARVADRLVVLCRGEVIADASPREALTPAVLAEAFGVRPVVEPDPLTGMAETMLRPIVAPVPRRGWVHVIAGGGRGAPVLARLAAAGFALSVGPLGEGDTDLPAARLCGARVLTHRPFAPIDDATDAEHRRWVREADMVILADVCWGQANLRNLIAAEEARRLIIIEGEPIARRDFTGGVATALLRQLTARRLTLDALLPALIEEPA